MLHVFVCAIHLAHSLFVPIRGFPRTCTFPFILHVEAVLRACSLFQALKFLIRHAYYQIYIPIEILDAPRPVVWLVALFRFFSCIFFSYSSVSSSFLSYRCHFQYTPDDL